MSYAQQIPNGQSTPAAVDAALATMSAEELRVVIHELLLELDERAHARVIGTLIARAVRGSGWVPPAISAEQVSEVLEFVKAAERVGQAEPSEVDDYLQLGSAAFLRKDYPSAHQIFGALLPPIGDGEINLGQDELLDEVLGTDPAECAAQYVVSAYMLATPAERAEVVRAAISKVYGTGSFCWLLREMEQVAVEPLPGIQDFLLQWRALLASKLSGERKGNWDREENLWLREVVQRLEGTEGLAKIARSTRRADDLRAWCKGLVEAGDWKAALSAFEEAAELVADKDYALGEFLDGASLAAQILGHEDLPARLERAWRTCPSMLRLRRWLGSSTSKTSLGKRIAAALEVCPKEAARQQALLHVLTRDFALAADLLMAAPGLGWSSGEHPGHLLFPLFTRFLGGQRMPVARRTGLFAYREMGLEEPEPLATDRDGPRLATPELDVLLELAGVDGISDPVSRATVLAAMKQAAEKRIAGVTEQKRRQHYDYAAELVATCITCDRTAETVRWVAALKAKYSRFPALRGALDRAMGTP